ncbi:MAG: hypothetical protein ABSC41_07270 [Acidimicrobiales bacterium]
MAVPLPGRPSDVADAEETVLIGAVPPPGVAVGGTADVRPCPIGR